MVDRTRRAVVNRGALLAAGTGGVVAVSGCSMITGGLEVTEVTPESTAAGNVVLHATVENSASETKSGTLSGTVDVQGGESYATSREVALEGGQSDTFDLEFDIEFSDSLTEDRYTYSASME
jgi:hypothetical protein